LVVARDFPDVQHRFGVAPVVFPLEFLPEIRHRRVLKEKAD
jgi:hypothetical protein